MAIYLILLMRTLNHAAFAGSRVVVSLYALDHGANQMTIGIFMALDGPLPAVHCCLRSVNSRIVSVPGCRCSWGSMGVVGAYIVTSAFPWFAVLFISALLIGTSFHFFFVTVTGITGGIGGEENRVWNYAMVSLGFSSASFVGTGSGGIFLTSRHLPALLILASFPAITILLLCFKGDFFPVM